jgi:hypothetical protein
MDGFDFEFDFPIAHAEVVRLDLLTGRATKVIDVDPSIGPIFGAVPVQAR